jgi:hypothetical protein
MIQFGRKIVVLADLWFAAVGSAIAQNSEGAEECWTSYANCAGASLDDEAWRSI